MRVHVCEQPRIFRTCVCCPTTRVAKEEPLLGSEAVYRFSRLALHCFLISRIGHHQATKIGDGFTNYELTVLVDSLFDLKPVELVNDTLGPRLKRFEILISPPVCKIARCIKLPSLIIKAMRHFVADYRAHASIVECVVSLRIEKRRLQNARGKDYLVNLRIVVGVYRRWRHTPLHSIDRSANLIQVSSFLKRVRSESVVNVGTAIHLQRRVVAPFIRVANLVEKRIELNNSLLACCVAHPVERADIAFQRQFEIPHHLQRSSLGRGWKSLL